MDTNRRVTDAAGDDQTRRTEPSPSNESEPSAPAAERASRGATIGRYVVLDILGRGGMGTVYRARDPQLGRVVALKVIDTRSTDRSSRWRTQRRSLREAIAMAQLSHPNVLPVYDVGETDNRVYLAMELVHGQTLRQWLRRRTRSVAECLEVFIEAARGLQAAHLAKLVHRDFKPDNVLVGDDGRVRVMDFGLALPSPESMHSADPARWSSLGMSTADDRLTQTNAVMGTPAYMSCEQIRGEPVGPAADQFAFCVALFEALHGQRPFAGDTVADLDHNITSGRIRASTRAISPRLQRIIVRGLAPSPDDRHASMADVVRQLEKYRRGPGQRRITLAIVGGLGVVFTAALPARRASRCDEPPSTRWPGRRDAIAERFESQGVSFSAESFARIAPRLDAYVQTWSAAYARACDEEQAGDPSAPAVRRCLADRRARLDGLVDTLADADASVIEHAIEAVGSLRSIEECHAVEQLQAPAPPPEIAAAVAEARTRLARLEARQRAGRYEGAAGELEGLVDSTAHLDYLPLRAELLHRLGLLRGEAGAPAEAELPLVEAVHLAQASGHGALAVEAMSALVHLLGDDLSRPGDAFEWARHAQSELTRLGSPPRLRAELCLTMGVVYSKLNRLDEATAQLEQALELQTELDGEQSGPVATTLVNLGNVALRADNPDRAAAFYQRSLALQRVFYGDEHPKIALPLHNLGLVYERKDEPARAREYLTQALELRERAFGPVHPRVAATLGALARMDIADGDLAQASARQQRAFEITRTVFGEDHVSLADDINEIGTLDFRRARYEDALERYQEALRRYERALGPMHAKVAIAAYNIGLVHERLGRFASAREYYARSVEIREATPCPPHKLAKSLLGLGTMQTELGQPDAAIEHLERARSLRQAEGASVEKLADVSFALARATRSRDPARARRLAREASRQYEAAGPGSDAERADVDAGLDQLPNPRAPRSRR